MLSVDAPIILHATKRQICRSHLRGDFQKKKSGQSRKKMMIRTKTEKMMTEKKRKMKKKSSGVSLIMGLRLVRKKKLKVWLLRVKKRQKEA